MRAKCEMFVWFVKDYKAGRGGPESRFRDRGAELGHCRGDGWLFREERVSDVYSFALFLGGEAREIIGVGILNRRRYKSCWSPYR